MSRTQVMLKRSEVSMAKRPAVSRADFKGLKKLDAIHDFAREGDIKNLVKCIDTGVSVNTKDSEGRTPLHWAVDRGHINVAEVLLNKNADVNIKDNEGQTALHYAAVCERKEIAELLVKGNAETGIKDNEGKYPCDLSDSDWPCIRPRLNVTLQSGGRKKEIRYKWVTSYVKSRQIKPPLNLKVLKKGLWQRYWCLMVQKMCQLGNLLQLR